MQRAVAASLPKSARQEQTSTEGTAEARPRKLSATEELNRLATPLSAPLSAGPRPAPRRSGSLIAMLVVMLALLAPFAVSAIFSEPAEARASGAAGG